MTRRTVCVWLTMCMSAGVVLARPGVVKTTDGQTYEGEIDDKDPSVVEVTVRGIQNRIQRSRVASVEYADDFAKQFNDRLAKLAPTDVQGRLALAQEAFEQKQYVLAREAAVSAQTVDPNSADAASMLEIIRSQMRLEAAKNRPPEPVKPAGEAATQPGATQPTTGPKVLSAEQVNAMRQAELRPEDTSVRINIDADLKKRFATLTGMKPQEINAMKQPELAALILKQGTPEMRKDVKILSDPPSMMNFRTKVQPFVLQSCGTTGCHGTRSPQKFALVDPADTEAAAYTNFYILQKYIKQLPQSGNDVFGRGELRMIDRQSPADSMLLQYALPVATATYDHPEVRDYRAALRGLSDPRYKIISDWISKSLSPIDPDYGFEFTPSGPAATTQATTAPTTQAGTTNPATNKPGSATRPVRTVGPAPGPRGPGGPPPGGAVPHVPPPVPPPAR